MSWEQKKKLKKKIANMKYRAMHGGMVGVGSGRRPKRIGQVLTDMTDGTVIKQTMIAPQPTVERVSLSTKSSIEDFDNEILRLNNELLATGVPAAIKAGVDTLVKMTELKRKTEPPTKVERKPRPRMVIKIDEE